MDYILTGENLKAATAFQGNISKIHLDIPVAIYPSEVQIYLQLLT